MTTITRPSSDLLKSTITGKVVLVTGAASGIGLAIAKQWAGHGAKVILTDVNEERLETAKQEIGSGCDSYVCDVSSWTEQFRVFARIRAVHGVPDIVCLNAGIDPELVKAHKISDDERKKVCNQVLYNYLADEGSEEEESALKQPADIILDINLKGVMYGIKLAVHHMRHAQKPGRIIVVGSAASYVGFADQDIYVASKHAVLGLVRATSSRTDVREAGIVLSMVAPWLTETPLVKELSEVVKGNVSSTAEDVAWAVSYLASAPSDRANGKCLWTQGTEITEVEESYGKWLGGLIKS